MKKIQNNLKSNILKSNIQLPTSDLRLLTSAKGITLTSLVIYIIAMTIIMATISGITIYFYKNAHLIQDTTENSNSLTRFNTYFTNDIKEEKIKAQLQDEGEKIVLTKNDTEQITYTVAGDGIYRNKVKICNNIQQGTTFELKENYNETKTIHKTQIIVNIKIGETETIEKRLEYIINN